MIKRSWQILALSLLGLSVLPSLAHACQCARLSWQEQVALSDAIFVGRVIEAQPLRYVVLQVGERFKGDLSRQVRIQTGESDCDYFLPPTVAEPGADFLIFATIRKGRVMVSRCLGSGPASGKVDGLMRLRQAG